MKIPYPLSKRLSFSILAMQFLILDSVSSLNITNEYLTHKCLLNQGKYKSGSKYEQNLNDLARDLRTERFSKSGLSHTTMGQSTPDSVTFVFQCRGDTFGSKCHKCADAAVVEFQKRCPMNKGGIIWYDQCFLYVSMIRDEIPIKTNYDNIVSMHNSNNVKEDAKLFAKRAMDLLSELTLRVEKPAEFGSIIIENAEGEKRLGKNKLYATVQCMASTLDCKSCLAWSITKLFNNGNIKQGGRVLGTNCNVRYELYPFFRS